ncbi:MAG: pyridoxamine 5'-phosphate oxidase family protein [Clostridiales bacterium]|nr:pyridoxamine 5'-phosphate oxidase family protein [Clostridiales bacterium]
MRRRDREIKDIDEIVRLLEDNKICHLAMCAGEQPYVVPMLYAYEGGSMYFHCAEVGQKLDMIRANPNVCFEVQASQTEEVIENSGKPCYWGISYESVIGFGKAEILGDRETKIKVYNLIVGKMKPPGYVHSEEMYTEKKIKGTFIIKVKIDSMTGKKWDGTKPGVGL